MEKNDRLDTNEIVQQLEKLNDAMEGLQDIIGALSDSIDNLQETEAKSVELKALDMGIR